ncbi:hypothetical protein PhCBS80983_g04712 [Powellomyces hirtus]|uniref:ABC transporter domain-containing protein n=1 Tax=Powellomyces hirtus TaxID=109895 RepID=A0A507DWU6_9FUNG|nr:hypothetical protein PhCBS80983_g04712 [Powellomyces hirtus]
MVKATVSSALPRVALAVALLLVSLLSPLVAAQPQPQPPQSDAERWAAAHGWISTSGSSLLPPALAIDDAGRVGVAADGAPVNILSSFATIPTPTAVPRLPPGRALPSSLPIAMPAAFPTGSGGRPLPMATEFPIAFRNTTVDQAFNEAIANLTSNGTEVERQVRNLSPERKADALLLAAAVIKTNVMGSIALMLDERNCSYIRANWTCTAGFFCQSPLDNGNATVPPSERNRCPPGFLCPPDTYQPTYCCPGFVCPTPAEILICPAGHWCPVGTVNPISCRFLAHCPEGTNVAPRFGVATFLIATFLVMSVFFTLRRYVVSKRNRKYTRRLDAKEAQKQQMLESGSSNTLGPLLDEYFDDDDPAAGGAGGYDSEKSAPPPALVEGHRRFDINFHNLGLRLPNGVEIMKGVSGSLKSGRLCAVMGPSGAGKTTFVSLLTNKAKRTEGSVNINGVDEELSHYRKLIGFVPQEDIMLRELPVRDLLMHSALMRLPAEWSNKRKKDLVLDTIAFLGLDHIMNSTVGDEVERGISGGQRKRVNIGMELVAAPSVLFLDEPTSGLDSATSFEVCQLLHTIAREQSMTIAAVVHSPSPTAFDQFDDLLLLGKGGRVIYFGPRAQAMDYFARIGFENVYAASASDFFMDIATGRIPCTRTKNFKPSMLFSCWEMEQAGSDPALGLKDRSLLPRKKTMIQRLQKRWSVFAAIAAVLIDVGEYFKDIADECWASAKNMLRRDPVRATPNAVTVFWLCYLRACSQLYRSRGRFWFDQIVHVLCGVFISVATFKNDYLGLFPPAMCAMAPPALQLGAGCGKAIDQLAPSGMFIALGVIFAGVTVGGATFGRERVVFWRDASNGMPALPYFLAKWVADIPRIVMAAIMYSSALLLLLPFHGRLVDVFVLVLTLYFTSFCTGYFLSSVLEPHSVPLASTGFVLLWCMLFGGVTPDLLDVLTKDMYAPFRWLWAISAPRWMIEAWYIKETAARPWIELSEQPLGHGYHRDNYTTAIANVMYIGVGWAVLGLLGLKLVNRGKQK